MSKSNKRNKGRVKTRTIGPSQFYQRVTAVGRIANQLAVEKLTDTERNNYQVETAHLLTMCYMLADVMAEFFRKAEAAYKKVGKEFSYERKMEINKFVSDIGKVKSQGEKLAAYGLNLKGAAGGVFTDHCDYLQELIPLFFDRIGDDSRAGYVAECILNKIYSDYTSKLKYFEMFGFKAITRNKKEADEQRQLARWRKRERERKAALIAGRTPPPELPFPWPDRDKQMYIDF